MRITRTAVLEDHEKLLLKEVASIKCTEMQCMDCPLMVERYGGQMDCVRDITKLCLNQHRIKLD